MMHDFCVTQKHVILYLTNMVADMDRMRAGGVHFSYDSTAPCYLGIMRRGGDGRDLKWFTGQSLFCTHVMGGWSDGDKVTVDMDGGEGNQFPFFPSLHEPFDPVKATGRIRRFTVDLSRKSDNRFQVETLYPHISGALARQDDRFHTLPYRFGYLNSFGAGGGGWAIIDHQQGTTQMASVPDYSLSEMMLRTAQARRCGGRWLSDRTGQQHEGIRAVRPDPDRHQGCRRRSGCAGQDAVQMCRAGAWLLGRCQRHPRCRIGTGRLIGQAGDSPRLKRVCGQGQPAAQPAIERENPANVV